MTQLYLSVALGTAATLTALTLLLLRVTMHGHRPALTLARRWSVSSKRRSLMILAPLAAVAAWSFSSIPAWHLPTSSLHLPVAGIVGPSKNPADEQALNALRDYAAKIDNKEHSDSTPNQASAAAELPAVDVMVAKLIARLQEQPNDVAGWKMLGWSYLNTNRAAEAIEAYQTALKLDPGNTEIEKALKAAQSAQPASADVPASQNTTAEASLADASAEQGDMVRGMVERLAARLEKSPIDEDGWSQLIRSRMVLGEKDAALAALSKALSAFPDDAAAQERITTTAQSLGLERPEQPQN